MNGIIPMSGKVCATCRPAAASCPSGVCRLLGTDDWFESVNMRPASRKLPSLGVHQWFVRYDDWISLQVATHVGVRRWIGHLMGIK